MKGIVEGNDRKALSGRWISAGLWILGFTLAAASCSRPERQARELIASVKEQYAPDRRTDLFEVSADWRGGHLVLSGETSSNEAKHALFRQLDSAGIEVVDSVRLLPGDEVGSQLFGITRLSVINLRVKPSHTAEMATQVLLGTPLRILKDDDGWLLVQTPERYIAWTPASGLTRVDSLGLAEWQAAPKLIYTGEFGQAVRSPGSGEIVSDLVLGNLLQVAGETDGFYRITFPDGRIAYIRKAEARLMADWMDELDPSGASIIGVASQLLGAPYLWGGTSSKGVDCSGFTKTAYFMNGIILPRDASQQVLAGEPVPIYQADTESIPVGLENLRMGDLIFFTNDPARRNDPDARITHVGIYMANGEFIHSSGLVHRSSLVDTAANYSDHHARTLTKARRILAATPGKATGVTFITDHPLY